MQNFKVGDIVRTKAEYWDLSYHNITAIVKKIDSIYIAVLWLEGPEIGIQSKLFLAKYFELAQPIENVCEDAQAESNCTCPIFILIDDGCICNGNK